jgi:hypothetical protein
MIPVCCPQTWEHVGVMACPLRCLTWVGLGPETHRLGGLKSLVLPYGVRLEQTKLQMEALPPSKHKFSRQICRPMPSRPSYSQLKVVRVSKSATFARGYQPLDMWYCGIRTPAPPIRSTISALYFFIFTTALPISCPMMAWCRAICRRPDKGRC